jgi:hypothetical protein
MSKQQNLYEQDFYAWARRNAALLRAGRIAEADCEHLAEEIEDMGKAQRHTLRSHLRQLIVHLLKLQYSPAEQPRRGWFDEVQNARAEIADRLADSPSLAPEVEAMLLDIWPRARRQANDALLAFGEHVRLPQVCPYTPEQALDDGFVPSGPASSR